jgi:hypothetical protein
MNISVAGLGYGLVAKVLLTVWQNGHKKVVELTFKSGSN